jgi:hypothetical protein
MKHKISNVTTKEGTEEKEKLCTIGHSSLCSYGPSRTKEIKFVGEEAENGESKVTTTL